MSADIQIITKCSSCEGINQILESVQTIKENIIKLRDENRECERVRDQYLIHLRQCMKDQETLREILKTLRWQMGCQPIDQINEKIATSAQKIEEAQASCQIGANQLDSMAANLSQQGMAGQMVKQHGNSAFEEAKVPVPPPPPALAAELLRPTVMKHQSYLSDSDLKFKYSLHTNGDQRQILGACFSRNGKMIALTTGNSAIIVNSENGAVISTAQLPQAGLIEPSHKAICFSIDNNYVAFSGQANDCYLIQVQTGAVTNRFIGHTQEISAIEFSPNGKWMITAGLDGLINVWSTQTFENVKKLQQIAPIVSLVTSEDADLYVAGFTNGFVGIYSADFNYPMNTFQAHESKLNCLDISPLTCMIATTSDDCTTKIWSIIRGPAVCKHTLKFHGDNPVVLAAFSANDPIIITVGKDSTIVIQNYKTVTPLYTIKINHNSVFELSHSPTSRMFLMTSDDSSLSVWEYVSI
jgi:hypothetical protein